MAEWSIAAVLKTVELKGSWGSNPYLSAAYSQKITNTRTIFDCTGVFFPCLLPADMPGKPLSPRDYSMNHPVT